MANRISICGRERENVMLFEDILEDLQAGYVDPVNPTKLFETAVSAMLKVSIFALCAFVCYAALFLSLRD